jgi:hypothetical protein
MGSGRLFRIGAFSIQYINNFRMGHFRSVFLQYRRRLGAEYIWRWPIDYSVGLGLGFKFELWLDVGHFSGRLG